LAYCTNGFSKWLLRPASTDMQISKFLTFYIHLKIISTERLTQLLPAVKQSIPFSKSLFHEILAKCHLWQIIPIAFPVRWGLTRTQTQPLLIWCQVTGIFSSKHAKFTIKIVVPI
jgi:hypothetical protein